MGGSKKPQIPGLSSQFAYSPAESPAMIKRRADKFYIGIPCETTHQEKRVPLTPSAVSVLVSNGHRIIIESKAGVAAGFKDRDYTEAGGEIALDKKKIFEADILLKIAPPSKDEFDLLKYGQIIISPIQLSTLDHDYFSALLKKKVTSLAFEYVRDESGSFPFVRSMSEIAGNSAILLASEYLNYNNNGNGILLGGISGVAPARVIILGAGVVGEYAARTALGLGATVKIFDNNIYKLMRMQNNMGMRLFTSIFDPDILVRELSQADVAIGAIHSETGRTPVIVTEDMVSKMKDGSIIVDVSIDQGGCFETSTVTSHTKPVYQKFGVIHYCVPNIPSRVPRTASQAISNILMPMLLKTNEYGSIDNYLHRSPGARNGTYIYKGCLTNKHISEKFGIKYTDIDLLFTAEI